MLRSTSRLVSKSVIAAFLTLSTTLVAAKDNSAANDTKKSLGVSVPAQSQAAPASKVATKAKLAATMSRVPLAFEANQGQTDPRVQYLSRGAGYTLFLTKDEAVLALSAGKKSADIVRLKLSGANAGTKVHAIERLGWDSNYFIGNDPKKWRPNVANYRRVDFDEVYPGISLAYYGNQQSLEHDFVVAPGADPKKIAMEIAGAKELLIDGEGNLLVKTAHGELRFEKPVVYQDLNGSRKEVAGKFILRHKKSVGFEIADYDRSKALTIDPVLNYSTYLSGATGANATSIAIDPTLNAYVTGTTTDISFPPASATALLSNGTVSAGTSNGFVAKVNPSGSGLLYNTFFGGNGAVSAPGHQYQVIAVDGSGDAFVGGYTLATDFPTSGAFQTGLPAVQQGFVIELNPAGSSLLYGTYLGGTGGAATAIKSVSINGGLVYLTGTTLDAAFPTSAGALQPSQSVSGQDAFVTVLDPAAGVGGLKYSTYLGGNGATDGNTIVAPAPASIYLAGNTNATNFPVSATAAQPANAGAGDGFVSKFDTTQATVGAGGSNATCSAGVITLTLTTANSFLVGEQVVVTGVPAGLSGTIFSPAAAVTLTSVSGSAPGSTVQYSTADPNCAPGPDTSAGGGTVHGGLVYSTYLGGTGIDTPYDIAVDSGGNAYVTGTTFSSTFPVVGGVQGALGVGATQNAFITKVNPGGTAFTYSTYLGGNHADIAYAIAVDPAVGTAWVTGNTTSTTFPTSNALQTSLLGAQNGFVTRINAGGNAVDYSTYLGGSGTDTANGLAVDPVTSIAYIAGQTSSADFPKTSSAYQTSPNAANSAFVAKLAANSGADPQFGLTPTADKDPISAGAVVNYTWAITNINAATATTLDLPTPQNAGNDLIVVNTVKDGSNTDLLGNGTCSKRVGTASSIGGVTCVLGSIAAGAGATVKVGATGANALQCGAGACPIASFPLNGSIASAEAPGAGNPATNSIVSTVLPAADIQVSAITASGNSSGAKKFVVQKDTSFTYSYTVTNAGPDTAPSITLTNTFSDAFPASTVTVVYSPLAGGSDNCVPSVGTFSCTITNLTSGTVATVTISGDPTSLLLAANARTTNQLDLTASVAPNAASYIDNTLGNDSASNTSNALERVATYTSTMLVAGPAEQQVGTLTYTVTAHNSGPSTVANMRVQITLDRGAAPNFTSLLGNDGAAGCAAPVGQTVTCTSANPIASNANYTITFTATAPVTINGDAAPATQTFTDGAGGVIAHAVVDTNPATVVSDDTGTAQVAATGASSATVERRSDLSVGALTATAGPTALSATQSFDLTAGSTNTNYTIPGATVVYTLTPTLPATSFASGGAVQGGGVTTGANCVNTTAAPSPTLVYTCTIAAPGAPGSLSNAGQAIHLVISTPVTNNVNAGTVSTAAYTSNACIAGPVTNASDPGNGCTGNNLSTTAGADPSSTVQRQGDLDITTTPFAQNAGTANPRSLAVTTKYNVSVKNNGPDTALNVKVKFTLTPTAITIPGGGQFVSNITALTPGVNCVQAANTFDVDCTINSIGSGVTVDPGLQLTLPILDTVGSGTTAGADITLNALLGAQVSTTDTTGGNNSNATTVTSHEQRTADVAINSVPLSATRSASVLANTPGAASGATITTNLTSPMSMSFTLTNAGPDTASNVPVKLTNINASAPSVNIAGISSSPGSTCSLSGADITCTVSAVPPAGPTPITVTFTPPTPTSMTFGGGAAVSSSFTTTAAISPAPTAYVDGNGSNDTNGTTVTVTEQRQSDLRFTSFSAVPPSTIDLSGTLTYTAGITNAGPDPALKEKLQLTLSTGAVTTPFAFVSAGSTVDVGAGSNPLAAAATNGCVAGSSTTLDCEFDGAMPVGAAPGWTIKVTPPLTSAMNGGAASDAMTTQGLFGSFSVWDNGPAGAPANPGNNREPVAVGTTIQRQDDLGVAVAQTAATVNIGDPQTYTLTLTNAGPNTAPNVTVTNTLPAGFVVSGVVCSAGVTTCDAAGVNFALTTFTTASSPQTITVNGSFPNGALGAGVQSASKIDSATIGSTAVVETNPADNSGSVTTTLQRGSDLGIAVAQTAGTVNIGDPQTYTLTLTNGGPNDATNVTVANTLPAGFSVTGVVCSAGVTTCDPAGVNFAVTTFTTASSPQTITINGSFPAGALGAGVASASKSDSATIGSTTVVDSNAANNASSATTTLQRGADLGVAVAQTSATVNIGDPQTYTLTLTNGGPNDATNVTVANTLPAGFNVTSVNCSGGVTTCDPAGLSFALTTFTTAQSPQTITINGSFPAGALGAGVPSASKNDSATISSTTVVDSNAVNNASSATTTLQRGADLGVAVAQLAGTLNIGDPQTYTITLTNGGPNDATNVTVANTLPAGFNVTSVVCSGGVTTCDAAGANFALATFTVASSPQTITINGSFPAGALGAGAANASKTDSVTIGSTTVVDSNAANNASSATATLQRSSDLGIVVAQTSNTVSIGAPQTYTITLTNAGPNDATNVTVANTLPAGFNVTSVNCSGGVTTCDPAGLNFALTTFTTAQSPQTITINGNFPNGALANNVVQDNTKSDSANITSTSVVDPNLANNASSVTTTLQRSAHLSITTMTGVPTVTPGLLYVGPDFNNQQITYTITAANNGPDDAVGAVVTQVLPPGFSLVSANATYGGPPNPCSSSGVGTITVTCDFGSFGAAPGVIITNGTSATITIVAQTTVTALNTSLASGTATTNASIASPLVSDPGGAQPNTASVSTTMHGEADLATNPIISSGVVSGNASIFAGDDEIFTISVKNVSAANTHPSQPNLTFSATLPKDYVVVGITTSGNVTGCPATPMAAPGAGLRTSFTCTIPNGLQLNQSETILVRAHVPSGITNLASSVDANIHSLNAPADGEEAGLTANNANTLATNVGLAADLTVVPGTVITGTAPNATLVGTPTGFTVKVTNIAPAAYNPGAPNPQIGGSTATGVNVNTVFNAVPTAAPEGTITLTGITNNFGAACPASVTLVGGAGNISCNGGTIASGANGTITFNATPLRIGSLTMAPTATTAVNDPVNGNNTTNVNERVDNTPVCAGAGCLPITAVDANSGNSPLVLPQNVTVQYNAVTVQGSTTMTVAPLAASCQVLDSTAPVVIGGSNPGTSNVVNDLAHVPYHGILSNGSRTYVCGTGSPLSYTLTTTATATGSANVCVNYTGTSFHKPDRARLVLLTGGGASDVTVAAGFAQNTSICGAVPLTNGAPATVEVVEPSNARPNLTSATAVGTTSTGRGGNTVTLDASLVNDIDNGDGCNGTASTCSDFPFVSYSWSSTSFSGVGSVPGATPPPVSINGTPSSIVVTLTVADAYGNSESRSMTVNFTGGTGGGGGGGGGTNFNTNRSVPKGQAASFTTDLDNTGGSVSGKLDIEDTSKALLLKNQITCTVSPNTVAAGARLTGVTILCSTQGQVFGKLTPPTTGNEGDAPMLAGMIGITGLPLLGMLMMPGKSRRRRLLKMWAAVGLVLLFSMFQVACGGGGATSFGGAPTLQNAGTPSGTYQVVLGVTNGNTVTALPATGVVPSTAAETGSTVAPTTFTLTVQ